MSGNVYNYRTGKTFSTDMNEYVSDDGKTRNMLVEQLFVDLFDPKRTDQLCVDNFKILYGAFYGDHILEVAQITTVDDLLDIRVAEYLAFAITGSRGHAMIKWSQEHGGWVVRFGKWYGDEHVLSSDLPRAFLLAVARDMRYIVEEYHATQT